VIESCLVALGPGDTPNPSPEAAGLTLRGPERLSSLTSLIDDRRNKYSVCRPPGFHQEVDSTLHDEEATRRVHAGQAPPAWRARSMDFEKKQEDRRYRQNPARELSLILGQAARKAEKPWEQP
jgi:hypothetical protein